MRKWIFIFAFSLISKSPGLYAQCVIGADAGPDIHICNSNIVVSLHGNGYSASGQLNFHWYGSGGAFSAATSQNTTYTLTAMEATFFATIMLTVTDPVTGCLTNDTLRIFLGGCPSQGLITGTVFNDLDSNGVQDSGETGIPGKIVSNGSYAAITNPTGYFELAVPNGGFEVYTLLTPGWTASSPLSLTAVVNSDTLTNYNYGMYLTPNRTEVAVHLFSSFTRPGFASPHTIYYENKGSAIASGTIELKYASPLTYNGSNPAHDTHDSFTQILTYTYTNLLPGESRYIFPAFSLPAATPLNLVLTSLISITPVINDVYLANNYDTLIRITAGSFDPNEKQVRPAGVNAEHYIRSTDKLEYIISFQNTGTADAINVVVTDTLENTLDAYSLQMLAASHHYRMEMDENKVVKWIFENIMLPDSNTNEPESHGFIRFKIRQKPNHSDGTEIRNSAAIYFDFNVPVITNTTLSTVGDDFFLTASVLRKNSTEESVSIYPNPTTDHLYIDGKSAVLNYQVLSLNGSILAEGKYLEGINTSMLQKGIYILKIATENSIEYKRLIIQ